MITRELTIGHLVLLLLKTFFFFLLCCITIFYLECHLMKVILEASTVHTKLYIYILINDHVYPYN